MAVHRLLQPTPSLSILTCASKLSHFCGFAELACQQFLRDERARAHLRWQRFLSSSEGSFFFLENGHINCCGTSKLEPIQGR